MQWSKALLLGITVLATASSVEGRSGGKGILRVRLNSFQNPQAKDVEGNCCRNYRRGPTCRGSCRTFFRVCATHSPRPLILPATPQTRPASANVSSTPAEEMKVFRAPVPRALLLGGRRRRGQRRARTSAVTGRSRGRVPHIPCTLGLIVTEVIANNSLDASEEGALDITFPFSSPWPINFKLILEAWHDVTGTLFQTQEALRIDERVGKLISRHVGRHALEAGMEWLSYSYSHERTSLQYSIKVNCASPFYGAQCSKSCEDLGTKNSHFECTDAGVVQCVDGWEGEECDVPICREGCDPVHGYCTQPGECRCSLGWRGENCSECTPLPGCQNGYCNSTSFECLCEEGWDGLFCSQPICKEGCHATRGYCDLPGECKCRIGWGGDTCQECKPLPGCINGHCTKPLECRCDPGWTGLFCQTPVCAANCSKEHGACVEPGECRCDVGWWGENCDTCFPYPGCKQGYCTEPWECVCNPGWIGMLCDQPDNGGYCSEHTEACLNGGTCIDVPGARNFTCSCPSLFTGQRCDYLADLDQATSSSSPEATGDPESVQVVTADSSSPKGTYSLLQPTPVPGRASRMNLTKDERRLLLQNTARISFRRPKLVSATDKSGGLPFKVFERKLIPLPVFLPRVSEIIPGKEGPVRLFKTIEKKPTPILVLDNVSQDEKENMLITKASPEEDDQTPDDNQLDENRRFIRHQQGGPDPSQIVERRPSTRAPRPSPRPSGPSPGSSSTSSPTQLRSAPSKLMRIRERPLLVSAQASALPRPNPVSPGTLRMRTTPLQQSQANSKPTTTSTSTTTTERSNAPPQEEPAWSSSEAAPEGRELPAEPQTYYEQNSNGRVHIGDVSEVDEGAPHEEIYDAFIELKKV
ncbi:uncharacterized protein LOC119575270 [Penaeus monodon]|uniref:uncharacterized protein LOC119575270 n=1 Tax=Penaeus monodon TaxID=6687 RepID=UPI0018A7B899|nr:uncharacterized protein LOC119575270 [Penaeus monodon]